METRMILIGALILLTLFVLFIGKGGEKQQNKIKVYGSMGCGWTRKQLEHFGDRAEFIDCTKTQCPSFVSGFPTIERADGTISVGFSKE